jgi:MFS family permease
VQQKLYKGDYAYYALFIISLANFFGYLDRLIVCAVLSGIKETLKLSDTKAGFLWTAFTLGYIVVAPLVGFLSDRSSRTRIFSVCIFIWSLATVGSGLANNFAQLVIARVLTGIGEAGCLIIGPSLISDYFPRLFRGRALAVFFLCMPLGGAAGYLVGSKIAAIYSWREAFFAVGTPGIAVSILIFFLADPPRGVMETHEAFPSIKNVKEYLGLLRIKPFVLIILAQAFFVFAIIPPIHFGGSFLERFEEAGRQITKGGSIIALVAGIIGSIASGFIGDKLARKIKGAYSIVASFGLLLGLLFIVGAFLSPINIIRIILAFFGFFSFFACMPAFNTQVANIVPASQRSMAFAITIFTMHLFGDMPSPTLFGYLSDTFGEKNALLLPPVMILISCLLCYLSFRSIQKPAKKSVEPVCLQR